MHLSREQVRAIDRRAVNEYGIPSIVLMENAGRGCAELLLTLNPDRRPVIILCGPGNNGGDGFVMARHLHNHGLGPTLIVPGDPQTLPTDAAINYRAARAAGIPITEHLITADAWYVDALFGTGLTRPLGPPYAELVNRLNDRNAPVLAVDLPSGLDCDTGEPLGPCVRATHTATFVALKLGFHNPNARLFTGTVHIIDIGAPRKLIDEYQ